MDGPASPYPSIITVNGLSGNIANVTVTLSGLAHTFPDDIEYLCITAGEFLKDHGFAPAGVAS